MANKKLRIGFIGQGYVGGNCADDFERRGYEVVRYSLENIYIKNKGGIKECDIVFIAVPTPTTPRGFDDSIIKKVLPLVGKNRIAVIKSTILPGRTKALQKLFSDRIILRSPEFLKEATAKKDAAHPFINIIGVPSFSKKHLSAARLVHKTLPKSPSSITVSSEEAEIIKYTHNGNAFSQIIFMNLMYDLADKFGAKWQNIEKGLKADPSISKEYSKPVHGGGRGVGGHCLVKDFAALSKLYAKISKDKIGLSLLNKMEKKNIELLRKSWKDLEILKGVYGK